MNQKAAIRNAELPQGVLTIEAASRFNGMLKFEGTVVIAGKVEGEVHSDEIRVEKGGQVSAQIACTRLLISGSVTGDVYADEIVEVAAGGSLNGEIRARAILIHPGASFEGSGQIGERRR